MSSRATTRLSDPALAVLAGLVLVDLAVVWSLPVLVGQDLPQHLSYARILSDYGDPSLPFRDAFVLPERVQPYFTTYLVLVGLARISSLGTACRIVYSAYVVGTAWAFRALVRAVHRTDGTPWTALFGAVLPWNPIQCVGFLPFMLALPVVLAGAAVVALERPRFRPMGLVLATAAAASLHFVAAACLVAFAFLYAAFSRTRSSVAALATTAGTSILTLGVWRALGDPGLAPFPWDDFVRSVRALGPAVGATAALGARWSSNADRLGYVVSTVLGPLPRSGKAVVLGAILGLVAVVVTERRRIRAGVRMPTAFGCAVLGLLVVAYATPTAMVLPEDICLLDFRVYVLAFMIGLALVPPAWLEPARCRTAVTLACAACTLLWARALHGVAGEASSVLGLLANVGPSDAVLALPFHDRSAFLDEENVVTHYFPVYHTGIGGGVTSLFWGRFSPHLPVGFREGRTPPRPPDWAPGEFTRAELESAPYVMVEWPDPDDGEQKARDADRLRDELEDGFDRVACDARWCLYRHAPGISPPEEARR